MKSREFIAWSLLSLFFGFLIISIFRNRKEQIFIRKYQTREEIQEQVNYLKDSFEIKYYKRELESYPFEHSKITADGK